MGEIILIGAMGALIIAGIVLAITIDNGGSKDTKQGYEKDKNNKMRKETIQEEIK